MSTPEEFAARRLELAAEEAAGAAKEAADTAARIAAEESYLSALPDLLPTLSLTDRWRELTVLPSRRFCWSVELHAADMIRLSLRSAFPGCRVAGLLHRSEPCFGGMLEGTLHFEFDDVLVALIRAGSAWSPVTFRTGESGWERVTGRHRWFVRVEDAVTYGVKHSAHGVPL